MNPASLLAGAAGGALVAAAVSLVLRSDSAAGPEPAAGAERLGELERAVVADRAAGEELSAALQDLTGRVARLEVVGQRAPVPAAATEPEVSAAESERSAAAPRKRAEIAPKEFRGLMTAVLRSAREGTASPEDQERFWRAARTTELVDDTITALEAAVAADPLDAETRLELADAYVAKLLTVPGGPERGLWGAKAESQWQEVVKAYPDHWEAQYGLAYNYSMYPDFLGKADAAIAGFERALAIQERSPLIAAHAKTYVDLARMHRQKGDHQKAREVLLMGKARHPDDEPIAAAIRALEK